MEELFKSIKLEGKYLEAFEEATKELGIEGEDKQVAEAITGLIQTIVNIEKLPLELEYMVMERELDRVREANAKLKAKVNALEEVNKKLEIENSNLINSLKAMKELSIADDRIEAVSPKVVTLEFRK